MRCGVSILFILFFGLGPLSASLQTDDGLRLPACCRRHGPHHCDMSGSMMAHAVEAASGKTILAVPSHCPLYPNGGFVPNAPIHALTSSTKGLPELLAEDHSPVAAHAAARMSQVRTRADRGPPASIIA